MRIINYYWDIALLFFIEINHSISNTLLNSFKLILLYLYTELKLEYKMDNKMEEASYII